MKSAEGVHKFIQPFCSRTHMTYFAIATVRTANAIEKAACLRMVIPKIVAAGTLQDFCFSKASHKQREQFNHTNSDHEHCECHGIVLQPVQPLLHGTPLCSQPRWARAAQSDNASGRPAFPCPLGSPRWEPLNGSGSQKNLILERGL
jgi:hypothetical protein